MSGTTKAGATTGGDGVAVNETDRLISSDKVEGTSVYNRAGESLGSVYTLMIDKYSGQVSYAVMSFGGFLGIGERYHPLPWKALTYDTGQGGYVVDVSREQLERAPSYARDETPWDQPGYGRSVHDYYGMAYLYGGI
jgi:hypothetical protein